ncbi:N/A [soil metagenome]
MKSGAEVHLVVFSLGEDEYALALAEVREILRAPEVVALAAPAPPAVGMVMHGAEWLPVLCMGELLGQPGAEKTAADRLLIARHPSAPNMGLLVDGVREVVTVSASRLADPPPLFGGHEASRVRSLVSLPGDRLVILLSIVDLLSRSTLDQLAVAMPADPAATP